MSSFGILSIGVVWRDQSIMGRIRQWWYIHFRGSMKSYSSSSVNYILSISSTSSAPVLWQVITLPIGKAGHYSTQSSTQSTLLPLIKYSIDFTPRRSNWHIWISRLNACVKSLTDINYDDVLKVDPPCFQQLQSVPLWLSKSRTVSNAKNSSPQTHWLVNKQHMPERLVYGPQHQQQERYASWTRSSSPIFPRNTWRCWTNKHSAFAGLVSIVSPKHR